MSERRFFGVVTDDKKRECTNDDEAVEDEALFVKKNFFFAKTKQVARLIDAIDAIRFKAALVQFCRRRKIAVVTTGGAGGLTDPTRIEVADLSRTWNDPLAAKRMWCLFEVAMAKKEGVPIRVLVPKKEEMALREAVMGEDGDDTLLRMMQSVDCSSATASVLEDEKNIRRRVYDALNVLMAMDIIAKEKKEIMWRGLPSTSEGNAARLHAELAAARASIEKKNAHLQELVEQYNSYQALLKRSDRSRIAEIASGMTYIELSADNAFYDAFTSALFLPHTDLSKFPSVHPANHRVPEPV